MSDPDTEVIQLRARLRDLTDGEQRLRAIFDAARDSVYLHGLDDNGVPGPFIDVNAVACEQMGYTRDELLALTALDIDAQEAPERMPAVIQTLVDEGHATFESVHVTRQGRRIPVEIDSRLFPLAGRRVILSVVRDVTERQQAQRALGESEARYRAIVEAFDGLIYICSADHRVEFMNQRLIERTGRDATGEPCHDVLHGVDHICPWCQNQRVQQGETVRWEVQSPRDQRWYYVVNTPIHHADGTISKQAMLIDITERKQLEERMQQAQKLESLGVLAGGIAHDFNNILVAVLGNAELASMELTPASAATTYIHEIAIAARRAADLCQQMLAYSGKGRFIIEPVDLSELVREMASMLRVSISHRATLSFELDPELPMISADATQMRQVVMNLLTNAAEAIDGDSGVITVRTTVSHEPSAVALLGHPLDPAPHVCLEVADSGCGMDGPTRTRLFEPFFTTKFTGRGLGMSAVLGIVRGHRGALAVESTPSQGTTVRILLPLSPDAAAPLHAPSVETSGGAGTILVVDDEETVLVVTRKMLERSGFDVLTADSGARAVELMRQHGGTIRCVLLDMVMPRMSGAQCLAQLRAMGPEVPVILSSGFSAHDAAPLIDAREAFGFVQKPYRLTDLLTAIKGALK